MRSAREIQFGLEEKGSHPARAAFAATGSMKRAPSLRQYELDQVRRVTALFP